MTYDFTILRQLRKKKGLTIANLSELCGVSYVALSKLERNQGNPELKTLDRISRALELPTHNLLALAERKHPVRAKEVRDEPHMEKAKTRHVSLDGVRIIYLEAQKGMAGVAPEMHQDDYEHCYVLKGRVRVTIRGTEHDLGPGEGIVWDCFFDHMYQALEASTFITVLTPKRP